METFVGTSQLRDFYEPSQANVCRNDGEEKLISHFGLLEIHAEAGNDGLELISDD